MDGDETADLHAIVCAPFRPASMILTSHREPSAWQGSLADLLPGPALVDRFGNSANGLENEGASD